MQHVRRSFEVVERKAHILLCMALLACSKPTEPVLEHHSAICINEVMAASSLADERSGGSGDWLELYNGGTTEQLASGEWFVTDDRDDLLKFELPGIALREMEHLRLWCDGNELVMEGVHASFRLASEGEWIALVRLVDGTPCIIDSIRYPPQHADHGLSFGRYPDGTQAWVITAIPTPRAPNEAPALDP